MKNRYIVLFFLLFTSFSLFSQNNYKIDFEIDNYENDTLLLAYFYADRQLIKDTIIADQQGNFAFTGNDTLESGVYILMFFPARDYIQFIINKNEPYFKLKGDYKNLARPQFEGSVDNELFYSYLDFIKDLKVSAQEINQKRADAVLLEKDSTVFDQQLEQLDNDVIKYQNDIITEHPKTVTSTLIKGNRDVSIPEFDAVGDELQQRRFYYYRDHFFDDIDLGDPSVLLTPFLHTKLERYLDNLSVQMPDSIIVAVDFLLKEMEPSEMTWKFYVAHFLNKYGKMQIIGMDAVYVHMVDQYYATGRTPWADEETLGKIIDNANKLRPVLLGKIAPDVTLYTQDEKPVRIHDIESPYTVLMFWAPDCGHCKESMPHIVDFNEKYKDKGVKTIAICTKHMDKTAGCWEFVKEKKLDGLYYNLADKFHRSRFQLKYNIRTTPQIFILDADKKIILKRIAIEKLDEVIGDILSRSDNNPDSVID